MLLRMKTILFIEDESAMHKTFGEVLNKAGYEMISALDGESGLRLAQASKPDLIVLDLILPKLHGFEVLGRLKENQETKDIPVVVLTNLESMAEVDRALELGAAAYLVKAQYSLEELIDKVRKILAE